MPQKRRRPPEKIEAMRKELLEDGATLQEIGVREGVTKQRISQLVGPIGGVAFRNRQHAQDRVERRREQVKSLAERRQSDQQIAEAIGISVFTVAKHRQRSGIFRHRKWSRDLICQKAIKWFRRYGYSPGVADWNPRQAIKIGCPERASRFYEFGEAPFSQTVYRHFDSWPEMIAEADLPPIPPGSQSHRRWRTEKAKAATE